MKIPKLSEFDLIASRQKLESTSWLFIAVFFNSKTFVTVSLHVSNGIKIITETKLLLSEDSANFEGLSLFTLVFVYYNVKGDDIYLLEFFCINTIIA